MEAEDWKEAAIRAYNLSQLEVTAGPAAGEAMADGRLAASTSPTAAGSPLLKMISCAIAADALHRGRGAGGELEGITSPRRSGCRRKMTGVPAALFRRRAFLYADWLLAPAERAAWGCVLAKLGGFAALRAHRTPGARVPATPLDARRKALRSAGRLRAIADRPARKMAPRHRPRPSPHANATRAALYTPCQVPADRIRPPPLPG